MLIFNASEPRFPLGQLNATPSVIERVPPEETGVALMRHAAGDWGNLCEEDKAANDAAVVQGLRILSSYETQGGITFWIITEWDRSSTTVLLPEDY